MFARPLVPLGRNVYRTPPTSKRFCLVPWERTVLDFPIIAGNIALRWSKGRG